MVTPGLLVHSERLTRFGGRLKRDVTRARPQIAGSTGPCLLPAWKTGDSHPAGMAVTAAMTMRLWSLAGVPAQSHLAT